jgi:hypothetical protein
MVLQWYTSLSRQTRLVMGLVGLAVGSLGLYLDSRVNVDNARDKTLGDVRHVPQQQRAQAARRD